jgi:hypothetical protein
MRPYKKSFNAGNILLWIACVVTAIGVFLPYFSVGAFGFSESYALIDLGDSSVDGIVVLVLVAFTAFLNIFKLNTGNIVFSALSMLTILLEIAYYQSQMEDYSIVMDYGVGYYLLILGSIAMLITSIMGLVMHVSAKKRFQNGYY